MPNSIPIYVDDVDARLDNFDEVRLFRDTSPSGSFSTEVDTKSLVSGTEVYTFEDGGGDADSWYITDFYDTGSNTSSTSSAPFQSSGTTLKRLRVEIAQDAGTGFKGTCSSVGTASTLIDERLLDSGVDATFLEGAWLYRPDGDSGDKLRRVKSFDTATGAVTPTRDWSSGPSNNEEYHVFLLIPPVDSPGGQSSYDRVVRSALNQAWYEDTVIVGDGTQDAKKRYDISTWKPWVGKIAKVVYRSFDDTTGYATDRNANLDGQTWRVEENGHDEATLILSHAPGTDEQVMLTLYRTAAPLYQDDDVTRVPFDYAVAWGVYELFRTMSQLSPGKYTGEVSAAVANLDRIGRRYKPAPTVVLP